jgi:hypothetical protein
MDEPVAQMEEPVVQAACQIRPYLTELVGPQAAPALDTRIASLLEVARGGEDATDSLRSLLQSDEATSEFLAEILDDAPKYRPPEWQPRTVLRGLVDLPGDLLPMHAGKYGCPRGDYTWYRPDVGVVVPECPTHHIVLALIG